MSLKHVMYFVQTIYAEYGNNKNEVSNIHENDIKEILSASIKVFNLLETPCKKCNTALSY